MTAIGIDLGTTNSCAGVWKNGRVEIIVNEQGDRTSPSVVYFSSDDTTRKIGKPASVSGSRYPENTIFGVKRLIGRNYNDESVQNDIKKLPYKVVDNNGASAISLIHNKSEKILTPEEISASILTYMKKCCEDYLGNKIEDAVITVPAYFNNAQRKSTEDAARIAGLNPLRIINEPTAAAIAYGLEKKSEDSKIVIYDMGGGTLDVSLLELGDGIFEVLATDGDTHFGGEDIDEILVEHFIAEYKKKYGEDVRSNKRSLKRLRTQCEKIKRSLSTNKSANLEIDAFYKGEDYYTSISRAKFEIICSSFFKKALKPVENVLKAKNMDKSDIDEVILVGGSTRIPKIQEMLSEFFNGKNLCKEINPDESVAFGAAVQAAILTKVVDEQLDNIILLDTVPLSIGIEHQGCLMENIIDRHTKIPCKRNKVFTTAVDNQPGVTIRIFEGERASTKDNNLLGTFLLDGIPPARRGEPEIEITCDIDANSILTVTAKDKKTGKENKVTISDTNTLSADEIEKMVEEAKEYEEQDKLLRETLESKHKLENMAYNIKDHINKLDNNEETANVKKYFTEKVDNVLGWMSDNTNASKEEYDSKYKDLEKYFSELMEKTVSNNGTTDMPNEYEQNLNTDKTTGPTVDEVD